MSNETIINQVQAFMEQSKKHYYTSISERLEALVKIKNWVSANLNRIYEALATDLCKPEIESLLGEVNSVQTEIKIFEKKLNKWMKPKKVKSGVIYDFFYKSQVQLQPLGICLIIGPFNYPFQLCVLPLVESIASGNRNIVKCSSKTKATSAIMVKMIQETHLENWVFMLGDNANHDTIADIIKLSPDLVFFTGGTRGGQIIESQAREANVPTVMELGSACPVIVDETANIKMAAKKIAWGKAINAGQTCVGPNTVYVPKQLSEELIKEIENSFKSFYGPKPEESNEYAKIIDQNTFEKMVALVKTKTGKTLEVNSEKCKIRPTVITVEKGNSFACNEIFGPILFVVEVKDFNEAYSLVKIYHNNSLSSYYFGMDNERFNQLILNISAGSWNMNDVVMQVGNTCLPFGGIGHSGHGRYHGIAGLQTFSNLCSISKVKGKRDSFVKYPPYEKKQNIIKKILKV